MKSLVAVAEILILCATAGADCRPVVRVQAAHVAPVVVEPVFAAQFVPVTIPAYSVGTSQALDLTPLVEELRLLRASVQALRGGEAGELVPLPPEPEYVGLVRQNCASCHGTTPKGNKLSFFDSTGRFKQPTPEVLGAAINAIAAGTMPKGGKMDAGDRLKLISGLTAAPEAAAKMPAAK